MKKIIKKKMESSVLIKFPSIDRPETLKKFPNIIKTSSERSIQSSFLLYCKVLVNIVLAVAINLDVDTK